MNRQATTRILQYVKGTPGQGIFFPSDSYLQFRAYHDANRARCPNTRKSLIGYCVFLGDALISWRSKKQSVVSRSSVEAEYRSMASTTYEVTWILFLLRDLQVKHEKSVLLYYDNQGALHIAANLVSHERSKHIEGECHIVRNRVLDGTIKTFHVASKNQLADIFTKALGVDNYVRMVKKLGLINIFAHQVQYLEYIVDDQATRALLLRGGVKLDEINLNVGDARTNASDVEDKSRIDTSAMKGKTTIPKIEHEVMDMSYLMETIEAIPYYTQL